MTPLARRVVSPVLSEEMNTLFHHFHIVLHCFLLLPHRSLRTTFAVLHMLNNRKCEGGASRGMRLAPHARATAVKRGMCCKVKLNLKE